MEVRNHQEGIRMTAYSTLSRKGQTVIPAEIRRFLGAEPGDHIVFEVVDGEVRLRVSKRVSLRSLVGILPGSAPEDFSEVRKTAYAAKAKEKFSGEDVGVNE